MCFFHVNFYSFSLSLLFIRCKCHFKCLSQLSAVVVLRESWLGSLRARCSFKEKRLRRKKKASVVCSLQFNVWPHSPESLPSGSLFLNMLPWNHTSLFFPAKIYVSFCPLSPLRLLLNSCFPGVLHMYMNKPACFKRDLPIIDFAWILPPLICNLYLPIFCLLFRTVISALRWADFSGLCTFVPVTPSSFWSCFVLGHLFFWNLLVAWNLLHSNLGNLDLCALDTLK